MGRTPNYITIAKVMEYIIESEMEGRVDESNSYYPIYQELEELRVKAFDQYNLNYKRNYTKQNKNSQSDLNKSRAQEIYETWKNWKPEVKEHSYNDTTRYYKKNQPPSMSYFANKWNISRERVRQICLIFDLEKPKPSPLVHEECGTPYRNQTSHNPRCYTCDPPWITLECDYCKKKFNRRASLVKANLRNRGTRSRYKGGKYCSRECFKKIHFDSEWWKNSPVWQFYNDRKLMDEFIHWKNKGENNASDNSDNN